MKQALILYADGFEEIEGVTPFDYLRRAGISVAAAACSPRLEITGAHGLTITAGLTAKDALKQYSSAPDAVICPGGMPGASNIAACQEAVELILKTQAAGNVVAAICASPIVVFAKLGLLRGKTFTCFPGMEEQAEQWAGPDHKKLLENSKKTMNPAEIDGKLITGQGPGAAEEFSLALIRELLGQDAAEKVRKEAWLRVPRL
ncbi:MAG: DJ-1/PfpI family protein [Candidatus Adiutrix sp.]|jgi:4-methyl-5(b-hydroxyethyl)-thiazole monophosphate biosynthesis|nr:DJ-1/PfpI family protein [Candidatus Adiutrix sp.]